ncbi:family 20 glycosylhydrolase [Terrimonas sp. NA20]|uniref:beta-N-acetylhexosaminidase n=1 Tax=Terrimonas ginsenosidimutans TaxID=2908004 RepID=A0ABS9KN02_9BACT|nr:family 20 glycosylhydrolase [Terrimonas ginsenosidimutans]MCG2613707.1 family 20 glycosylhydrolase [Terrimonas ginsenosidimutans]
MKKILFVLLSATLGNLVFSQKNDLALIPEPVSVTQGSGSFVLNASTKVLHAPPSLDTIANMLAARLKQATGFRITTGLQTQNQSNKNTIALVLTGDASIPKEGYQLEVTANNVSLKAKDPSGIFYGIQTLLQLLPKEIESASAATAKWEIPVVKISDHPRFGWRGLMLDVSRHFFPKEEVKKFIDQMSRYKFNVLHWHLTDDQGWRVEIKSLPKLTEVGAWRVNKTGTFGRFSVPAADEPRDYGGFYTQDDIREIVQYAKERQINILPEIDVPGHSMAAIAAYPELTCTPGTYVVNSGEQFMIWPPGGHFYGTVDNSLCPANEKVYEFMDKVFTEIAQLFPFEYIHMGGDETARNFWEKSDAIKALMQKEKLANLDEVQSYFVKRMEKIINGKGKKMIGWDEILQGGLAPNAAVMSWRNMQHGAEAAKQGHEVVMTPTEFVYLDYMQSDVTMEPPVYASLRLKKTYQFDPLPEGVDPKWIKGGQGNLWTEQVYNIRQVQYMIWPRAFALSEVLWSPKDKKNWNALVPKIEAQFKRFDVAKIKYAPSMYDPDLKVKKVDSTNVSVELIPEIEGLTLHYSFDNSYPDEFYPSYKQPLTVPKDASLMRVISYRNGKPVGRMISITVAELKKRAGIK